MTKTDKRDVSSPSQRWRDLLRHGLNVLRNNWPYKLLALIIAVILWAMLISQEPSLTRPMTMENTRIAVNGLDELMGMGYTVLEGLNAQGQLDTRATIRANVPQLQIQNVSGSDFQLSVDLSELDTSAVTDGPVQVEAQVRYVNSEEHGTVVSITPETVTLTLDQYISAENAVRIPVSIVKTSEAPEGWYISDPTAQDLTYVSISGPSSIVNRVERVELRLDQSAVRLTEGRHDSDRSRFYLLDADGNEVEKSKLSVHLYPSGNTIESAYLTYDVYPTKALNLNENSLVTGEPAAGYHISGVSLTETVVSVAAPAEVLDGLTEDLTLITPVTISSNMTGTITRARTILKPDDRIVRLIPSSVYVTVVIEPDDQSETEIDTEPEASSQQEP